MLVKSEVLVLTDDILDDAYPDLTAALDIDGAPVWLTDASPTWPSEYPTDFRTNVATQGGYTIHTSVTAVTDGY